MPVGSPDFRQYTESTFTTAARKGKFRYEYGSASGITAGSTLNSNIFSNDTSERQYIATFSVIAANGDANKGSYVQVRPRDYSNNVVNARQAHFPNWDWEFDKEMPLPAEGGNLLLSVHNPPGAGSGLDIEWKSAVRTLQ